MSTASRKGIYAGCYWTGITMTLVCLALILASNTELGYWYEHSPFALSWAFGGFAILAFLAAEFYAPAASSGTRAADESSQPVLEEELVEV
jgi:hypothetical protein